MDSNKINPGLWKKIQQYYEKELYSDVLRNMCLYLIQIVQEKSDCDKDGEKLIDAVFLGDNPKFVINSHEDETDRDEQRGFAFILKGIICCIRNPLSHNIDFDFSKSQTDAIIKFVNDYILEKLISSKEFSYVDNWYEFIVDNDFVNSPEYADLIMESMPATVRYETLISIFANLIKLSDNNRNFVIKLLIKSLKKSEYTNFINFLNKNLINYSDGYYFMLFLDNFDPLIWNDLNKLVKMKLEEIICKSIFDGTVRNVDGAEIMNDGKLAIHIKEFFDYFELKEKMMNYIFLKLDGSIDQGKYVYKYLNRLILRDTNLKDQLFVEKIKKGLSDGNINYKNLLQYKFYGSSKNLWSEMFEKEYKNFKENEDYDWFIDIGF